MCAFFFREHKALPLFTAHDGGKFFSQRFSSSLFSFRLYLFLAIPPAFGPKHATTLSNAVPCAGHHCTLIPFLAPPPPPSVGGKISLSFPLRFGGENHSKNLEHHHFTASSRALFPTKCHFCDRVPFLFTSLPCCQTLCKPQ